MVRSDYDVIYDAYVEYGQGVAAKKIKEQKAKAECNQLFSHVERCLMIMDSSSSTIVEKNRRLSECKSLFQRYSIIDKSRPECITASLRNKMERLLKQVVIHEESQVAMFREREIGGERLSLEAILSEPSNVRRLMNTPIYKLLEGALKDTKYTIISKDDRNVYITQSGNKYHVADCPYCKRVQLIETTFAKVENAGYEPCRCIAGNKKKEDDKPKPAMTAFIDESVRENVWRKFDSGLTKTQASYSYIICSGNLKSENEISEANTLSRNACLANEAHDTNYAAIEAINLVLMKMAFAYNFEGDVIIYTDNNGAMQKWHKDMGNRFLAEHFNSVKVEHIARNKNTRADAVGRERIFTDAPRALLKRFEKLKEEIEQLNKENERLKKEIEDVKKYFPNPQKQIPNLIRELKLMAYEKE